MGIAYDHVVLATTDIDRAIQFYGEILGLEPTARRKQGDGTTEQVAFRVGELIFLLFQRDEYQSQDPTARRGLDHLAFALDGATYEEVLSRLRASGLIVRGPVVNDGAHGRGLATYFLDPDGIEIEIKSYDPQVIARNAPPES